MIERLTRRGAPKPGRPRRLRRGQALRRIGVVVGALTAIATTSVLVGDLALEGGSQSAPQRSSAASFYRAAADAPPAPPGRVIGSRLMAALPLLGSRALRFTFHSRDQAGGDVAVSAMLALPPGSGSARRPVVAWAHPTTGAAEACAPSLAARPFSLVEGATAFLAAGYAVVATDYPGMGVPGASSYLLGVTESNAVLDSVRAARELDPSLGPEVLLWGHSQGGQAALFAAERSSSYAPELRVMGVAVAAPAADLPTLLRDDIGDLSGVTISSYAIPAMSAAYRSQYASGELDRILTPAARAVTPRMAQLCLLDPELHRLAEPLIGNYVTADPGTTEPWATILRENSAPTDISVPVFVGQGRADELVRPESTAEYVSALCAEGADVEFREYDGVTHALAAYASLQAVLSWQSSIRRGAAPSGCGS